MPSPQSDSQMPAEFYADLKDALQPIIEKYDLRWDVRPMGCVVGESLIHLSLHFQQGRPLVTRKSVETEAYLRACFKYGLREQWLGKPIELEGKTLYIAGLRLKGKRKVILTDDFGNRFVAAPEPVRAAIAKTGLEVDPLPPGMAPDLFAEIIEPDRAIVLE